VPDTSLSVPQADRHLGASFETFYAVARPRIFRAIALVLDNSDVALDATEEAMTRAAERWHDVGGYDNPAGWVYRVALNWARTHLRGIARERNRLMFEPGYEHTLPDPQLIEAVRALPTRYRAVVVARFFLDWSVDETARVLQIPTGTVKTRTHRALQRLRSAIEES
jgi:RNA polymerase sigma factor (sigma-70 family)